MMNFDLNLNNYTPTELSEMFELPENYDKNMIEIKEAKLLASILNDPTIKKEFQEQMSNFLTQAKNILLSARPSRDVNTNSKMNHLLNKVEKEQQFSSSKITQSDDHIIQEKKDGFYLNSFPSEIYKGVINPLKKRTLKYHLNIDSRFRDNYFATDATNFNVILPTKITNVVEMKLTALEIPSFYCTIASKYNNHFFNLSIDNSCTTIIIPDGNYNITNLITAINDQISLADQIFSCFEFISEPINTKVGVDAAQTAINIASPNTTTGNISSYVIDFQSDIDGNSGENTTLILNLGWILGFKNGIYINNLQENNVLKLVSEGYSDVTGPKYVFLVIDDHNNSVNNNFISMYNNSLLQKNIIARVSLQNYVYGALELLLTKPREYFGPVDIQNLNIQLLDEYGRVLYFRGLDYSFCLELTIIYDI